MPSGPRQNRVAPDGQLHATRHKGAWMGNRGGRLHTDDHILGAARWKSKAWICCQLHFKNRHRQVMGNSYTELFFLDEATALAAGHRPCFECRRKDAVHFAQLFGSAHSPAASPMKAREMDAILHSQRIASPLSVPARTVPFGAIIKVSDKLMLVTQPGWRIWSFAGYGAPQPPFTQQVTCLTPPSICQVLRLGYAPKLHETAQT